MGSIFACVIAFDYLVDKLYRYNSAIANQAIHPMGIGKLVPAICKDGNNDVVMGVMYALVYVKNGWFV